MNLKHRTELGPILQERFTNGIGIEIGVQTGKFSKQILEVWEDCKSWFCIDPYKYFITGYKDGANVSQVAQDEIFKRAKKNLEDYKNKVVFLREESLNCLDYFYDESIDFIYIDGNHEFYYVIEELRKWYPKLKKGGIFSGHDYYNFEDKFTRIQVKDAVDKFVKDNKLNLYHGMSCGSWIIIKN